MQDDVEGMRGEVREAVHRQALECRRQRPARAGRVDRERVRLALVLPREHPREDREEEGEWRQEEREEHEPRVDRAPLHGERVEQALMLEEDREQEEHEAHLDEADEHPLGDVPPLEVADLVGEHREQLGRSELLDERVV